MLLLLFNTLYIIFLLFLLLGWWKTKSFLHSGKVLHTQVSVLIAVRNEAENILRLLQDLEKQTYDKDLFEVIIIDDHSTDKTPEKVRQFAEKASFTLQVLELRLFLPDYSPDENFKKQALTLGVEKANGELIMTTDGDCRVRERWIETFVDFYEQKNPKCITSGVKFSGEKSVFDKLQTLDFSSLIVSGAATLAWELPTMSNGANLAYPKQVFQDLNGYSGTAGTASGDDVFLVQKIHRHFPKEVLFLRNQEATVSTHAQSDFRRFFQQRLRWASKWNLYQDKKVVAVALFMFISNISWMLTILAVFLELYKTEWFFFQLFIRFWIEFVFLTKTAIYLRKVGFLWLEPLRQLLNPIYMVGLCVAVLFWKEYEWKGRKIKV